GPIEPDVLAEQRGNITDAPDAAGRDPAKVVFDETVPDGGHEDQAEAHTEQNCGQSAGSHTLRYQTGSRHPNDPNDPNVYFANADRPARIPIARARRAARAGPLSNAARARWPAEGSHL